MLAVSPITLADEHVRLEPLGLHHVEGLKRAAADGELWTIRVTSVPDPDDTRGYVERALQAFAEGHRLAFAVLDARSGEVIGSSSYHDIVPAVERLEIGYTWYAKSRQRTHVNASAKLLLMTHAFETLGAKLVGWRTDNYNFASQRAIERHGTRQPPFPLRSNRVPGRRLAAGADRAAAARARAARPLGGCGRARHSSRPGGLRARDRARRPHRVRGGAGVARGAARAARGRRDRRP